MNMMYEVNLKSSATDMKQEVKNIPIMTPDFGFNVEPSSNSSERQIKATWLGHACFFLQLPPPSSSSTSTSTSTPSRGFNILFDPVFEHRCSPSQYLGPARFTPVPCSPQDLPPIDVIVISHNHYDHFSVNTLDALAASNAKAKNSEGEKILLFLPLNTKYGLPKYVQKKYEIHELDWWESKEIVLKSQGQAEGETQDQSQRIRLTATPAQHFTSRGLFDRMKSLWASWAVEEVVQEGKGKGKGVKVWFGGDSVSLCLCVCVCVGEFVSI